MCFFHHCVNCAILVCSIWFVPYMYMPFLYMHFLLFVYCFVFSFLCIDAFFNIFFLAHAYRFSNSQLTLKFHLAGGAAVIDTLSSNAKLLICLVILLRWLVKRSTCLCNDKIRCTLDWCLLIEIKTNTCMHSETVQAHYRKKKRKKRLPVFQWNHAIFLHNFRKKKKKKRIQFP